MMHIKKLGVSRDFMFHIWEISMMSVCETLMRILRKIVRKWLDNMNEFYKPLIENNISICV